MQHTNKGVIKITKLKAIREKLGFTQEQVAQKVKISERCYQNYEAGIRTPKADTAKLIAKALNTTVEKLF